MTKEQVQRLYVLAKQIASEMEQSAFGCRWILDADAFGSPGARLDVFAPAAQQIINQTQQHLDEMRTLLEDEASEMTP
jgi:hypothetical protein